MVDQNQGPRCPICGPSPFSPRFEKKQRQFYRCQSCDLELQWPLPTQAELADYYENSFVDGMYQDFTAADEMKKMTANQRLSEVSRHIPIQGRWLDVGCANGVFVEKVGQRVPAEGVELSQCAVQAGRDRGLHLHLGTLDDLPDGDAFDNISAFDVLEHVLDPQRFIVQIRERLSDNGHVVLTVPNTGGIVRRLMGRRWYFYIPEEHLHYFNRSNLAQLLKQNGFEMVNVGATHKPMTYDYALTQFAEFNPLIYKLMRSVSWLIPKSLRAKPVPLPIGELRVIAKKVAAVPTRAPTETMSPATASI